MHRLLLPLFFIAFASTALAQNTVTLNPGRSPVLINKNIYGHFAEHLGRSIYDGFYVGDSSSIPNTNGVRKDVIAALRNLQIPILRWPGGCFADTYHWKNGTGPKAKRPAMVNKWWGGITEDNSFGTHDFLNMCELLGADPYLAANVGSGTVEEFADWVQYVNFDGVSPMSKLRQQNGRDKAWKVKYWGVGNEAWGCGGNMTPEYYANIYRQYATFMTDYNNQGLFRIASGANSSDFHWTETMMKNIPLNMVNGLGLHHYSVIDWAKKGSATEFTETQYFKTMQQAWRMDTLISQHAAIMDRYDPEKKIALAVDEWGGWYDVEKGTNPGFLYQQNTMRDAMIAGMTLNIFNNHADRVRLACLAQTINVLQAVILTQKEKLILTPTYHVMEMYKVHQNATLLPLQIQSEPYSNGNENLPAISVSASTDSLHRTHVSLVNINPIKVITVTLDLGTVKLANINGRILSSPKIADHNSFEEPTKVKPTNFKDFQVKGNNLSVTLPAFSVVVLEIK